MNKLPLLNVILLLAACASPPPRDDAAREERMNDLVMYAISLAETPYRYGGNNAENGFDCSGYVGHVYRQTLDISLPRTSKAISSVGQSLHPKELRPGDLVFFDTQRNPYSHVGIYVGEGKFVHAPKSGDRIRVERMELNYWKSRYNGARRVY